MFTSQTQVGLIKSIDFFFKPELIGMLHIGTPSLLRLVSTVWRVLKLLNIYKVWIKTLPTVCSTSQHSMLASRRQLLELNQWLFTVSWLTSCQNRPFIIDQYHINKQPHCHCALPNNFVTHFEIRLWKTLPEDVLLKLAISSHSKNYL